MGLFFQKERAAAERAPGIYRSRPEFLKHGVRGERYSPYIDVSPERRRNARVQNGMPGRCAFRTSKDERRDASQKQRRMPPSAPATSIRVCPAQGSTLSPIFGAAVVDEQGHGDRQAGGGALICLPGSSTKVKGEEAHDPIPWCRNFITDIDATRKRSGVHDRGLDADAHRHSDALPRRGGGVAQDQHSLAAREEGHSDIHAVQIRDYTENKTAAGG